MIQRLTFTRGLINLRKPTKGRCVATIGNFDGMHIGHQKVLEQVVAIARESHLPATAIIFEPQPREYFMPDKAPPRLLRLREKLVLFERYQMDHVLCLKFNADFAHWSAETFIQKILVDGLSVQHLVIGDDFRFGHDRQGDFALLKQAGQRHGFTVTSTSPVYLEGRRVSSTWVRAALAAGDFAKVQRLLGKSYTMSGRVVYGDKRGRQLGFATANINLQRVQSPLHGVFAIQVWGLRDTPVFGVANIGYRPTLGGTCMKLEAHLFDFNDDIYGRHLQVEFLHKIRDEQHFASLDALKKQIAEDVKTAKALFNVSTD